MPGVAACEAADRFAPPRLTARVLLTRPVLCRRQRSAQDQQSSKWRSRWEGSDATELPLLKRQFEDAVGNISTVTTKMKDLRSIKPDGWQDQHAHLCEKKRRLEEELSQLLKEKLQMREVELLLLRTLIISFD